MDGVNYFGISSISPGVTHLPKAKKGDHSLAPEWGYTVNDTDTVVLRGEYDLNDSLTAFAGWGHREGGYNALMTRASLAVLNMTSMTNSLSMAGWVVASKTWMPLQATPIC